MMVFSKCVVKGCWKCGEYSLPIVSSYSYAGIDFSCNGAWDMHRIFIKFRSGMRGQ